MNLTDLKVRKAIMAEMGSIGGRKRRANLLPERRKEIAKLAANQRWAHKKKCPEEILP